MTGQRSQVAVRHENTLQVAGKTIRTAEFPFLSLVTSSDVLKQLTHSTVKEDRQLSARLFKMAACLTLVTSAHGAFRQ